GAALDRVQAREHLDVGGVVAGTHGLHLSWAWMSGGAALCGLHQGRRPGRAPPGTRANFSWRTSAGSTKLWPAPFRPERSSPMRKSIFLLAMTVACVLAVPTAYAQAGNVSRLPGKTQHAPPPTPEEQVGPLD